MREPNHGEYRARMIDKLAQSRSALRDAAAALRACCEDDDIDDPTRVKVRGEWYAALDLAAALTAVADGGDYAPRPYVEPADEDEEATP